MTLKTTDSGHGGSSVGSHSPPNPLPEVNKGAWQINGSSHSPEINNSSGRQQINLLPNSGPPPRHLLPAKLKPSPAVKLHPPGFILDFKGKAAIFVFFKTF